MQIAQVAPKTRTQKEAIFDYAIPPEILPQIKPGVLVEIPFHGRKLPGIVLKLSRFTHTKKNLKKIIKIIDYRPVVDDVHIKLSEWMSDYYLSPLGKTLFENVAPPSLRIIKQLNSEESCILSVRTAKMRKKKYLIMANFQERMKFYLSAIQKTLARKKQVIIIMPDLSLIPFFTKHLKNPYVIIHSGLTLTQRFLEWGKIRSGKIDIVIGSISALFSPLTNLGLIIIDQEENETYKNDRNPRFHLVKVAEKLCELAAANLVIGSTTPRIETYYQALENNYILKKSSLKKEYDNTIVDMNFERQILSQPLQKAVEETIAQKQKILLVFNRKGQGRRLSCADCKWVFLCNKCGLPLIPENQEAICFHCEKTFKIPEVCPKCQSINLKPFGLGTKRLEKFVNDFWPKIKTIRIEEGFGDILNSITWDLAIATSYALKFNFPKIGLVAIIDADQSLNFPDFRTPEKSFQNFYKFLKIGERGIIQTYLPESHLVSSLARMDYHQFFINELVARKKYDFPPFSKLIRLLIKSPNETEAQQESQKIFQFLKKKYIEEESIVFLGPSPRFLKQQRGKFFWQIVIKIKLKTNLRIFAELKKDLLNLNKNIIVDIDPTNLL